VDGLALAMQLGRAGWNVQVLANEPLSSRSGYLIELGGEGLAAIERMGLLSQIVQSAECLSPLRWVDTRGKPLADSGSPSEKSLHVLRENLEELLFRKLPSAVEVRRGTTITRVNTSDSCVELMLSSGDTCDTDLLVVADGGNSRTRDLILGGEAAFRRPLGHHSASFVFEDVEVHRQLGGHCAVLSAPGRLVTLCPLKDEDVAATFAFRTTSEVRTRTPADEIQRAFGDLKWCVPKFLEHANKAQRMYYDRATHIKNSIWYRNRVAFLGDACHAYSLLPGQGCSASISAACFLADALIRRVPSDSAFESYQAHLMEQVARRRAATTRMRSWLMPDTRKGLLVRNSLLRIANVPGIRRFVRPAVNLSL
jgi:2-polyprenyl-6-methoxyphenol hydroxylase-like FAD-dependent oxidoreductase